MAKIKLVYLISVLIVGFNLTSCAKEDGSSTENNHSHPNKYQRVEESS